MRRGRCLAPDHGDARRTTVAQHPRGHVAYSSRAPGFACRAEGADWCQGTAARRRTPGTAATREKAVIGADQTRSCQATRRATCRATCRATRCATWRRRRDGCSCPGEVFHQATGTGDDMSLLRVNPIACAAHGVCAELLP